MLLIAIFLFFGISGFGSVSNLHDKDSITFNNKIIPQSILKEARIALSHYPELKNTPIEFHFKKNIKKSIMQAQPKFLSIFKKSENRSYLIIINKNFNIENKEFVIYDIPSEALIGWIGHELGHITDYNNRSGVNLLMFLFRATLPPTTILENLNVPLISMP